MIRLADALEVRWFMSRTSEGGLETRTILAIVLALFLVSDAAHGEGNPPIVLIVIDDIGVDKLSAYGNASAPPTPNIDSLASKGVRFDRAYGAPTCSPTRASLLTGLINRRTKIGGPIRTDRENVELGLSFDTLPELMKDRQSSLAGKWHLSSFRSAHANKHPGVSGFGWYAGSLGNLNHVSLEPAVSGNYYLWEKNDNGTPRIEFEYATTNTTNDAIERIEAMSEPWFLYVSYNAAHAPFSRNPPSGLYAGSDPSNPVEKYEATIRALDKEIGRLLESIPSDAYVILMGDNGTSRDFIGSSGRTGKWTLAERGVRIPLIITGPGISSSVSPSLVHVVDVSATILDLAGVDWSRTDGRSLLPFLRGSSSWDRSYVYQDSFKPNGGANYTRDNRMLRDGTYKLVRTLKGDSFYEPRGLEDGPNLLPAGLSPPQQAAYEALSTKLDRIVSEVQAGLPLSVW